MNEYNDSQKGRCEMNFDIEGYFQKKILEEEKSKKKWK